MGRRSYLRIYVYCGKEFLLAFFVAFLFFFFIFFINQLLLLAEEILSKHVPFKDVLLLILYSLPLIVSLSFPFSSLVGALMAIGGLSSTNEILSFQASGVSIRRIFLPFFLLGILFSLTSFIMNDYFLPMGTLNFGKLYRKLLYANPEMELEANSIKYYQDSVIVTGPIEGSTIFDITIIDKTPEDEKRIIHANQGYLADTYTQRGVISFELKDVFSHIFQPKRGKSFEYLSADRMTYNILLKDISFSIRNPGPSEMSSLDVWTTIKAKEVELNQKKTLHARNLYIDRWELMSLYRKLSFVEEDVTNYSGLVEDYNRYKNSVNRDISSKSLTIYRLEFNKKFAVPLGCFVFIFLAVPAGMITGRRGRAVGFGVGLMISLVYWSILFAGQTLGLRLDVSPFLSMWAPNVFVLFLAVLLYTLRRLR